MKVLRGFIDIVQMFTMKGNLDLEPQCTRLSPAVNWDCCSFS